MASERPTVEVLEQRVRALELERDAALRRVEELEREGQEWVTLPATAIICASSAHHLIGGWKGLGPALPPTIGTPEGVTWASHADRRENRVRLERKVNVFDATIPTQIETYIIQPQAFADVRIRAQKAITFTLDGVLATLTGDMPTVARLLNLSQKDPDKFFVAILRNGVPVPAGELDDIVMLSDGDAYVTVRISEPEAVVEEVEAVA